MISAFLNSLYSNLSFYADSPIVTMGDFFSFAISIWSESSINWLIPFTISHLSFFIFSSPSISSLKIFLSQLNFQVFSSRAWILIWSFFYSRLTATSCTFTSWCWVWYASIFTFNFFFVYFKIGLFFSTNPLILVSWPLVLSIDCCLRSLIFCLVNFISLRISFFSRAILVLSFCLSNSWSDLQANPSLTFIFKSWTLFWSSSSSSHSASSLAYLSISCNFFTLYLLSYS